MVEATICQCVQQRQFRLTANLPVVSEASASKFCEFSLVGYSASSLQALPASRTVLSACTVPVFSLVGYSASSVQALLVGRGVCQFCQLASS